MYTTESVLSLASC